MRLGLSLILTGALGIALLLALSSRPATASAHRSPHHRAAARPRRCVPGLSPGERRAASAALRRGWLAYFAVHAPGQRPKLLGPPKFLGEPSATMFVAEMPTAIRFAPAPAPVDLFFLTLLMRRRGCGPWGWSVWDATSAGPLP